MAPKGNFADLLKSAVTSGADIFVENSVISEYELTIRSNRA